jgi:hypothetical protein
VFNYWALLSTHLLPASDNFARKLVLQTDWITFVFWAILLLVTFVLVFYRRKVVLMIKALFSQRHFSQLLREGKLLNERIYLFDLLIIFLTQGLFIYFLLDRFFPTLFVSVPPLIWYLILVGLVLFDYFFKMMVAFIFTYLFEYDEERNGYYLNKLFYYSLNSLSLFPILILTYYTGVWQFLFIYVPVFISTYLLMCYRLFTLNTKKINPFHFFIYFCTFEILPYALLVKFLFLVEKTAVLM